MTFPYRPPLTLERLRRFFVSSKKASTFRKRQGSFNHKSLGLLCQLLTLLLVACAKQGLPPGGPADTTPPRIVEASPSPYSTGVPLDTPIEIGFSEDMDRESVEKSLFISPIPRGEMELKWGKKRLRINLPEGLVPDQTYAVTVGTGARDRHGNHLPSSYSFAFSTGSRLDQGEISGKVFQEGRQVMGAYLWAYNLKKASDPNPETDLPDYITQTDQEGNYLLSHLSSGTYRLFALVDRYGDGAYDVEEDPLGVPPHDVTLTGKAQVMAGNLVVAVRDTTAPRLITVRPRDRTHLLLRFDEQIQSPVARQNFSITQVLAEEERELPVRLAYLDSRDHTKCHLVTGIQELGKEYALTVTEVTDLAGNEIDPQANTATFFGSGEPDTTHPHVLFTSPRDSATGVPLDQVIEITFSKAMDRKAVERGFSFLDAGGRVVSGKYRWPDPTTLHFIPKRSLSPSSAYLVRLDPEAATDLDGTPLADSLVHIYFTTLRSDTLGAISGRVFDRTSGGDRGRIYIQAKPARKGSRTYKLEIESPGGYLFPAVLPGSYWISAFRDRDGNGRLSYGRAFPFIPAEGFAIYPDTVRVRSRWETEGIDLYFQ